MSSPGTLFCRGRDGSVHPHGTWPGPRLCCRLTVGAPAPQEPFLGVAQRGGCAWLLSPTRRGSRKGRLRNRFQVSRSTRRGASGGGSRPRQRAASPAMSPWHGRPGRGGLGPAIPSSGSGSSIRSGAQWAGLILAHQSRPHREATEAHAGAADANPPGNGRRPAAGLQISPTPAAPFATGFPHDLDGAGTVRTGGPPTFRRRQRWGGLQQRLTCMSCWWTGVPARPGAPLRGPTPV